MTPEQLDMYKRLQPLYKRVMGEWQVGDKGCTKIGSPGLIVSLKPETFIVRGQRTQIGDIWFKTIELVKDAELYDLNHLPLTIDSENPERGLWGMLDWNKLRQEQYGPDGEIAIYKLPYIEYCEELGIPVKDHPFAVGNPTTAILKALCEQEGV
jgi:hypothetical protein